MINFHDYVDENNGVALKSSTAKIGLIFQIIHIEY